MERTLEATREDFAAVRTGRANPGIYAKVLVDYYGNPTPLQQLASFAVQDARTILISPFDINALRDIEIALSSSEIGANPSNDGKDRKSTRLNSSHVAISYAVFCLNKKKEQTRHTIKK